MIIDASKNTLMFWGFGKFFPRTLRKVFRYCVSRKKFVYFVGSIDPVRNSRFERLRFNDDPIPLFLGFHDVAVCNPQLIPPFFWQGNHSLAQDFEPFFPICILCCLCHMSL
jgi:hypothetical protein